VNLCVITFRIEVGGLKSRYKKQGKRNKWKKQGQFVIKIQETRAKKQVEGAVGNQ